MIIIVTVIHIIVSIGLILVVLLQQGKGAEIGAVFGGSSSTVFGSSGAGNFLTKLTTGMAVVFMITSLTLGYFAGQRPSASIFDQRTPVTQPESTPSVAPPAQQQSGEKSNPANPAAPAAQGARPEKPTSP
ncbi:MAG TPA: preprotein translocase subunit SecG [Candidatus Binatia bacterium]|nr:preprotein translocase subunit SecG [Candidatus Binatia bacterium]